VSCVVFVLVGDGRVQSSASFVSNFKTIDYNIQK
jgi:hypothetical protein